MGVGVGSFEAGAGSSGAGVGSSGVEAGSFGVGAGSSGVGADCNHVAVQDLLKKRTFYNYIYLCFIQETIIFQNVIKKNNFHFFVDKSQHVIV